MARVFDGREYRDETPEEITERKKLEAEYQEQPKELTPEERIAQLEEELAATKILLGLEA